MTTKLRATLRVAEGGRVVIPAALRKQLGLDIGAEVVMTVEEDCATLMNARAARRRARQRVRRYLAPGVRLSDELSADRRKEAARE